DKRHPNSTTPPTITTHQRPPGREGAKIPWKFRRFRRLQAELESGSENHLPLPERNVLVLGPLAQPFMESRIGDTTGLGQPGRSEGRLPAPHACDQPVHAAGAAGHHMSGPVVRLLERR